jgi:DNA-directed RNA polymerase subunit RPC12/RpoP
MADILTFVKSEKKEPHTQGQAKCISCQHTWEAVVPSKDLEITDWLECPSCHLHKGLFNHPFRIGDTTWTCGCGCDVFRLTPEFTYCVNCGREQKFD